MVDFNQLRTIINAWDPIDLIAIYAPIDEYDFEVTDILNFLHDNPDTTVPQLAKKIKEIFTHWFSDVYERTDEEEVAKQILGVSKTE